MRAPATDGLDVAVWTDEGPGPSEDVLADVVFYVPPYLGGAQPLAAMARRSRRHLRPNHETRSDVNVGLSADVPADTESLTEPRAGGRQPLVFAIYPRSSSC